MMRINIPVVWFTMAMTPLTVAIVGFLLVTPVHANGEHLGSQEVYADDVGPYRLTVTTVPVVGLMHLSIYLSLKDTDFPVLGAELTVQAERSGVEPITLGPLPAPRVDLGPNWFAVDLPVDESGEWIFTLDVDAPLAPETVTFPVFVRGSGGVSIALVAFIAAGVGIVGLFLVRTWQKSRQQG